MYYTRDLAAHAIMQIHAKSQHPPSLSKRQYPVQNTEVITRNLQPVPSALPHDPVSSFILSAHPRPLKGNWHTGFAIDFHSSYKGAEWNRSGIGDLVYRLKYESDASVLPLLVEHTRHLFAAQPEMSQFDIIVAVPSSAQREFSPVHEFCGELAKSLNKPTQIILAKTRQTKPQKEMHTLPQKRDNVTGAFRVNSDITGRRILLVDDLFDSGATLEEITRLLLKHGASCVNVLTLTRTIHSDA
jgi:ATP-dependent DNA helicase RecQ